MMATGRRILGLFVKYAEIIIYSAQWNARIQVKEDMNFLKNYRKILKINN